MAACIILVEINVSLVCENRLPLARSLPAFCRLGITKIVDNGRDTQCSLSCNLQQRHFFSKKISQVPKLMTLHVYV